MPSCYMMWLTHWIVNYIASASDMSNRATQLHTFFITWKIAACCCSLWGSPHISCRKIEHFSYRGVKCQINITTFSYDIFEICIYFFFAKYIYALYVPYMYFNTEMQNEYRLIFKSLFILEMGLFIWNKWCLIKWGNPKAPAAGRLDQTPQRPLPVSDSDRLRQLSVYSNARILSRRCNWIKSHYS